MSTSVRRIVIKENQKMNKQVNQPIYKKLI